MDDGRGDLIEDLKLKILILKSRLNVQIYFEQLHLQQIGSLHKSNILGTALEAENQNLQTINKHLRQNLERSSQVHDSKLISRKNITNLIDNDQVLSDNTHNQPRANNSKSTTRISPKTITDEHEDSQAEDSIKRSRKLLKDDQSKRYIESIKAKNKKFRADLMALKQDRSEAEQKIKVYDQVVYRLNGRINELENEAHELRNELKLIRPKLKTIDELEMTNENLSKALLTWDDDLRRFRESRKEIDVIRGEWKKFESISNSLEIENRKIRDELKKQTCMNEDLKLENDLFRRKDRERIDKERQHILFKRKIRLKSFSVEDVTRQGNSSERSLSLRKDRGDDEEVDGERRKNGHEDSKVESPIGGKETEEE
ncbi:hypothetical protein BY996DRAFT_6671403 [Phakopsora pachyrhizi]|nr:hypothetical protein BY996DRAFT_6671403 [Phakopsora pachyrhizi]